MEYYDLTVKREGHLAKVILDRPESLNTLSVRMLRELRDIALALKNDPEIHVVIITGAGGKFSAGLDLKDREIKKMLSGSMKERRECAVLGPRVCSAWEDIGAITIAAIEGFCIGGGVSIVIACDFRIMGETAFMRIPEIELGLNYSWGSIPRLLHLIGPSKAREMIILCERVPAEKCVAWGLAGDMVPDGRAMEAAEVMAEKILKKPPVPVAMTKLAIKNITSALDNASIHMDMDQFILTTYTKDHEEGLAAFLNKRRPLFEGK